MLQFGPEGLAAFEKIAAAVSVDIVVGSQRRAPAVTRPHEILHAEDRMAIDVVVVLLQRLDLKPHDGAALPVEEKPGIDGAAEKHVVVGIEEMLGQTGNPGQKQLDGARIEDGKNLRRHDLPVGNHPYAQIRRIEPRRRLVVGHNIDAAYPRREFLHRTQGITQFVVLDVAALPRHLGVHLPVGRQKFIFLRQPHRVVPIDPKVYQINVHHMLVYRLHVSATPESGRTTGRSPGRRTP